jgi:hypothetical protein
MGIALFAVMLALAAGLRAQDLSGVAIENKFDTAQAHVFIATLRPHVPVPSPNGHATNRVLIFLDNGELKRQEGGDSPKSIEFHRGDVLWRPASGAYVAENTSDRAIRILEIDLKGKPAGPLPTTKLDPPLVDAKHYQVVLENEQVRVLRVHYEAHEKGALHEHILNRVVLSLNDQPGVKADDVHISTAATHTEQAGEQPADRIAVELK